MGRTIQRLNELGVTPALLDTMAVDGSTILVYEHLIHQVDRARADARSERERRENTEAMFAQNMRKRPASPRPDAGPSEVQHQYKKKKGAPLMNRVQDGPPKLPLEARIDTSRPVSQAPASVSSSGVGPSSVPPTATLGVEAEVPAHQPAVNKWEPIEYSLPGVLPSYPEPMKDTFVEPSTIPGDSDDDYSDDSMGPAQPTQPVAEQKTHPGRIPDGLGVMTRGRGTVPERDNTFHGIVNPRHIYVSRLSNTAYVGRTAVNAASFEAKGEPYVATNPLYKKVPRGFPLTPKELAHLISCIRNEKIYNETRVEATVLLHEFDRVSRKFASHLRDKTMIEVMSTSQLPEFRCPDVRIWEVNNEKEGSKVVTPTRTDGMDIDLQCRYIGLTSWPGTPNHRLGMAMDHSHRVHRRSVMGLLLAKAMIPDRDRYKATFQRLLVALVTDIGRYQAYVSNWQEKHPDDKFPTHATVGNTKSMVPMKGIGPNTTVDEVARHLVDNRVPVAWVDHAYTYGLHYLDQAYREGDAHLEFLAATDQQRHRSLKEHGDTEPPAIPEWDGWWNPSPEDRERIRVSLVAELKKGQDSHSDERWMCVGENPHFTHLLYRPSDVVLKYEQDHPSLPLPLTSPWTEDPLAVSTELPPASPIAPL